MVERVAAVLARTSLFEGREHLAPSVARDVIAAMREPTDAMAAAVYDQAEPGFADEPGNPTAPDDAWRQMIDEALK